MKIQLLSDITDYCQPAEKQLGVFASHKWLSAYGPELRVAGIYRDDGQLTGGFYYMETRRAGFKFIKLPPYTPYCGLWFRSASTNKSSSNSFTKEVLTAVSDYFLQQKAALTVLALPPSVSDTQPFIWANYKVIPNYTYRVRLDRPLSEITANFESKNRNAISKALKDGVEVTGNDQSPEDLHAFFTSSLTDAGANVYGAELRNIFEKLSDHSTSFCLSARKDGVLLGIVYCVFDNTSCYYLLGGLKRSQKMQGINNLLIQKSMEKAQDLGCSIFDFEGSMLKGVEKFFRGFGPEIFPYYTLNKAWMPLEILLKFKKPHIF